VVRTFVAYPEIKPLLDKSTAIAKYFQTKEGQSELLYWTGRSYEPYRDTVTPVATQWTSYCESIDSILRVKGATSLWMLSSRGSVTLTADEWLELEAISRILTPFTHSVNELQRNDQPTTSRLWGFHVITTRFLEQLEVPPLIRPAKERLLALLHESASEIANVRQTAACLVDPKMACYADSIDAGQLAEAKAWLADFVESTTQVLSCTHHSLGAGECTVGIFTLTHP